MKTNLDRYFILSVLIFLFAGVLHALRLFYGLDLVLGGYQIPQYVSALAVVMTLGMALIGLTYLKKK
jgi:hypothetical protein